jgi:hypothetical protein
MKILLVAALAVSTLGGAAPPQGPVHPSVRPHLVAYYDFDHPQPGDPLLEQDRGRSGTEIELLNGAPRVRDAAYPGAGLALQTAQVGPDVSGNDDFKAGIYSASGVRTLRGLNGVRGVTVMGWFKRQMDDQPALNTTTPDPADRYNAIGLAGLLSGDSDGHAVRSLLEIIYVGSELKLVALGRRIDGAGSQTFAADESWTTLLPRGQWVHLAATFDYDSGTMALYRDGKPVPGRYTTAGDPWQLETPGPHVTSPTDPRGIKIGGSFPQNTAERNPCTCRMDALMVLDSALPATTVKAQYRYMTGKR